MSLDARFEQLCAWLKILQFEKREETPFSVPVPASSDASFRRYYRVQAGEDTYIVMDAPPQYESCEPFVRIAAWLEQIGVYVPEVLAWDRENGFLLLTDLGKTTYFDALSADNADSFYQAALKTLVQIQLKGGVYLKQLPEYDARLLGEEMDLFVHWLVERFLGLQVPAFWWEVRGALMEAALAQPKVFVHRDFHSRNLMCSTPLPGVLDFQDAVAGPLTYDAVSLLRDCYVRWPAEHVAYWRSGYFQQLVDAGIQQAGDEKPFNRAFDLMGVQRHLKAAGIFARLWLRDGKARYLDDVPNTLQYLVEVGADYPEACSLSEWVAHEVLPAFRMKHV